MLHYIICYTPLHYFKNLSVFSWFHLWPEEFLHAAILASQVWIWKKSLALQLVQSDDEMSNRNKDSYKEENVQLKKRIRELEKALEFSRLETLSRDMLIDKAEEYFDIPIRKKSGAK